MCLASTHSILSKSLSRKPYYSTNTTNLKNVEVACFGFLVLVDIVIECIYIVYALDEVKNTYSVAMSTKYDWICQKGHVHTNIKVSLFNAIR